MPSSSGVTIAEHARARDPGPWAGSRRRRVTAAGMVTVVMLLGACGSDGDEPEYGNKQQQVEDPGSAGATTASFCDTVAQVADAEAAGDALAMADALQLVVDDLPEDVAQDVRDFISGLEAAPPNEVPSGDSTENPEAEQAYRTYARAECGTDAMPEGGTDGSSTSSTSAPESPTTAQPGAGDNGQASG
jgi:hypothetical protein